MEIDLKKGYEELWTRQYEKAWVTGMVSLGQPPSLEDGEDAKSKGFVHRLMFCSIFNYFEEQQAKLEETETKLEEAERKLLELQIDRIECGKDICINNSVTPKSPVSSPIPPGDITLFETSSEGEMSQSLFSHRPKIPNKIPKSPKSKKENRPEIISMPPPKLPQKSKSNWINPARSKNTLMSSSTPFKICNSSEAGPTTPKLSLSRTKRLVQTKLDVNSFGERVKQEDLSCSEEYLGGVWAECEEGSGSRMKRKNIISGEQVHLGGGDSPGKRLLKTSTKQNSPEKMQFDAPVQVKQEIVTPEKGCMYLEGVDFEETFFETPDKPLVGEPAEYMSGIGNATMDVIKSFDELPGENKPGPTFKYKPDKAIRKKDERSKLDGVACDKCREYYEDIAYQLTEAEIERIMKMCSKHRQQYAARAYDTPPGYWRTDFPSTMEMIDRGHLEVEQKDSSPDSYRRPETKKRNTFANWS